MTDSITLDKAIKFALRIVKLYRYLTDEKKEYVLSKLVLISGTHIAKLFVMLWRVKEGRILGRTCSKRKSGLPRQSFGF